MAKYVCSVCGYEYDEATGDPDNGIAPGTKWEDIPEDFTCPLCGVGKDMFEAQANACAFFMPAGKIARTVRSFTQLLSNFAEIFLLFVDLLTFACYNFPNEWKICSGTKSKIVCGRHGRPFFAVY